MSELTNEQWEEINRKLRDPFDPTQIDFRVQSEKKSERTGKVQIVAYIDARAVQDRLDEVIGAGNWSFDWTPLVIDNGEVMVAKGVLTVYGVSKADAGSASNFEQSLGAVSHCFKRAAVHWGIARYLYDLPQLWITMAGKYLSPQELADLRRRLPRPGSKERQRIDTAGLDDPEGGQTAERSAQPVPRQPVAAPRPIASSAADELATEQQMESIRKLRLHLGKPETDDVFTYSQARNVIITLSGEYRAQRDAKASAQTVA